MGKGAGGLGMLAMQASYGMQDFITVMGMGGGLRAAMGGMSNNLSQMVMILGMMGTISMPLAAALSVATALGAALVPMLFDTGKGGQAAAEGLEALERSLKRVKQATDDLAASRKATDVSDIETFGQAGKDIKRTMKERDELDKQVVDELAAQKQREAQQTPVVASRAIPKHLQNLKPGDRGNLDILGLIDDALGGKGEFGVASEIRRNMEATGKPVDVGGGRQISKEGNNFVVRQLPTGKELEKFQKERQDSEEKVSQLGKEREDKEKRITNAKQKQAQLTNEEADRLRDQNDDTDSLDKKLTHINAEQKKRVKEAQEFASTGDARGPQMILEAQLWGDRARHEARVDDLDKSERKGIEANEAFIKKREQREKEAGHLAHQMEGETLGDRAAKFQNIRAQLEERRDWIEKNVRDPDERNRLLKLAVDSASHQEALVRPRGGDKTTAGGLADAIQKALFEGDATKYMKDTAKNTQDQLKKLDDVISAINNQVAKAN
jgi:predicted transglutaminase-like cysteine proteinase